MTKEERELLIEVAVGAGAIFAKLADGVSIHDIRDAHDVYVERVADLVMRVKKDGERAAQTVKA